MMDIATILSIIAILVSVISGYPSFRLQMMELRERRARPTKEAQSLKRIVISNSLLTVASLVINILLTDKLNTADVIRISLAVSIHVSLFFAQVIMYLVSRQQSLVETIMRVVDQHRAELNSHAKKLALEVKDPPVADQDL